MDEIIMRRLKHLQRLEDTHEQDFRDRMNAEESRSEQLQTELSNVLSADWNRKRRKSVGAPVRKPLPKGWRKEHWKTLQSMAADYAGANATNKEEAVLALEAYEAVLTLPPVA